MSFHIKELSEISTLGDVAELLGLSKAQLTYLLRVRPEHSRYTIFQIPKRRSGVRTIAAPRSDLKSIQQKLVAKLTEWYPLRNSVHGFVAERSILTNAKVHICKRYVLNVDLDNFFPSINFGRVRGLFITLGAPKSGATILSQICCHQGSLPQGAPTSPILSNMICARLDRHLISLAKQFKCYITRYVDDITFSKKSTVFPPEIATLDDSGNAVVGPELRKVIEGNGFRINTNKVWLFDNKHRQMVTGLIVNTKCNVPRRFVRQIRSMIHAWRKHGLELAEQEHAAKYYRRARKLREMPSYPLILCGKLAFLKMVKGVSDEVYRNLQRQLLTVFPEYQKIIERENSTMTKRDIFISHASEDKESIVRPLAQAMIAAGWRVWYDEYEISVGDSLREKIDDGLSKSRFGVVVLSEHFFAKHWPQKELNGLAAKETASGKKTILPLLHGIDIAYLAKKSPLLADLYALETSKLELNEIVDKLSKVLSSNP